MWGISASEGYEGLQDMKKARKGDTSESFNVLRDMVASPYFGPSHKQAVFDFAKLTSNVVFGVVSGKALGAAADGLVAQRFVNHRPGCTLCGGGFWGYPDQYGDRNNPRLYWK